MKKYEFVEGDEKIVAPGIVAKRIRALVAIPALLWAPAVAPGDLGGYIVETINLAQVSGDAWVYGDALVYGNAQVYGNARVYGNALVSGDAQVYGDARVYGDAWVYGDALVYGNAQVYGDARVYGDAWVYGDALVYGNAWVYGDARVYGDAQVYGNARVYGNALVSGDAWVYGDARVYGDAQVTEECSRTPVLISGLRYVVTITDKHLRAGCQCHTFDKWAAFTKIEIGEMDGKDGLRFYPTLIILMNTILKTKEL